MDELGYTRGVVPSEEKERMTPILEIEKLIAGGLLQCDLYLGGDIDMVIDIHGPIHYRNGTSQPMDSAIYTERIYRNYHKHYLEIPYEFFDTFMS